MGKKKVTKLIHEGSFAAEVDVELLYEDEGWAPYLSLEEAQKLETVRKALRNGDSETAAQHARVFKLIPIAA